MILLFAILLALAVGIAVAGIVLERGGAGARALAARLRRVGGPADLGPTQGVERDVRYSAIPWFDRAKASRCCCTRRACRCVPASW
jgi:hypothetical protein